MDALVIDLTHGGFRIALELSKLENSKYKNIWAWDIYHSLNQKQESHLKLKGIKLTNKIPEVDEIEIIAPVHCPMKIKTDLTHHEAVKLILESWKRAEVPVIEVTGVKGKSTVVGMLKEIFSSYDPLILSSLGAEYLKNQQLISLKKNISITPASIIETIKLAQNLKYGICIFETSLGGTGLADVGVLTNIVENYPIGKGKSKASMAKSQIFESKIICCEKETLDNYYPDRAKRLIYKINTFSLKNQKANLSLLEAKYGLKKTQLKILVNDLKTISGKDLNFQFQVKTFAPAPHHASNLLAAISVALTMDLKANTIINKIKNFQGVKGRSSLKIIKGINLIEEVNPGINVKALEKILQMAKNLDECYVILGGQYGITCEEIDEFKTSSLLDNYINSIPLILTHQLGKGIQKKMKADSKFIEDPQDALNSAIECGAKNIIFIYRSNYANLKYR